MEVERPPNTFALIGQILHFLRSYDYMVCDGRPSHFASASFLENWDVPVFIDQLLDVGVRDFLARRVSHSLSVIRGDDISLLIA